MKKIILTVEGKPEIVDFDKNFYSESHNVPALWIGGQIVGLGDGYGDWGEDKDVEHLRWRLDPDKTYRVTIEEVEEP